MFRGGRGFPCSSPRFDLWVGRISWRREKLCTPVFWLENSKDCIVHGVAESDTTERLLLFRGGRGQKRKRRGVQGDSQAPQPLNLFPGPDYFLVVSNKLALLFFSYLYHLLCIYCTISSPTTSLVDYFYTHLHISTGQSSPAIIRDKLTNYLPFSGFSCCFLLETTSITRSQQGCVPWWALKEQGSMRVKEERYTSRPTK